MAEATPGSCVTPPPVLVRFPQIRFEALTVTTHVQVCSEIPHTLPPLSWFRCRSAAGLASHHVAVGVLFAAPPLPAFPSIPPRIEIGLRALHALSRAVSTSRFPIAAPIVPETNTLLGIGQTGLPNRVRASALAPIHATRC